MLFRSRGENKIALGSHVFLLDDDELRGNIREEKTKSIAYEINTRRSQKVPRLYVG